MCDKVPYQYHSQAIAALRGLSKAKRVHFRVYFCADCQVYHLTSGKHGMRPYSKPKYPFTVKHWGRKA